MPTRDSRIQISERRLLLVEGRDESHLFGKLIKTCFTNIGIQVMDIGGKTTLGKNLKTVYTAALSRPPLLSIGIVRDADTSAADSFKSVCDSVEHAGYTPPSAHAEFWGPTPAIGIIIVTPGK